QRAALAYSAQPIDVLRRRRLLHELDAVLRDLLDPSRRLVGRPRGVWIDADDPGETLPDAAEDLLVILAMPELHLQDLEALRRGGGGALGHDIRLGDADRERRGRRLLCGDPRIA